MSLFYRPTSALLVSAFALSLSGCGPGDSENYGKSRGGVNSNSNDTPETHLAAVKDHAAFSQLIRTPDCVSATKDVSSDVYEGDFLRQEKQEDGRLFECNERLRIFVDNRTSLLKVIEECSDLRGTGGILLQSTSRYTIAGNRLNIADFATLDVVANGTTLVLNHPRASAPVSLRLKEKEPLTSETDHGLFAFLCSARD